MPLWPGIMATVGSAASIGVGASVGREGPAVLFGSTLSSWLGQQLGLGRAAMRILLGCGAAAAVSSSFNAPLAGALFAHEVIVGHYALSAFAPIVLSSIAATMVTRSVYGDFPAFNIPAVDSIYWIEFPAFAITGIACGLAAVVMMRGIEIVRYAGNRLNLPAVMRPALAGFLVGLIALELPDVLGIGYEQTDRALRNLYPIAMVLTLIAAKMVATTVCLGWGFGGGVFSPSVALGALVGVAVGTVATMVGPDLSSGPAAYALVGMGSMAAAVLGAPISTTLIIYEFTGDYTVTIATMVSTHLYGQKSFFLSQLRHNGVLLDGGHDVSALKGTNVIDCLSSSASMCTLDSTRAQVRALLLTTNADEIFVVDETGCFVGVVQGSDLAASSDHNDSESIADLVHDTKTVVFADDTIENAVRSILAAKVGQLPVIDNEDNRHFIGSVAAQDLLRSVNLALLDATAASDEQITKTDDR